MPDRERSSMKSTTKAWVLTTVSGRYDEEFIKHTVTLLRKAQVLRFQSL